MALLTLLARQREDKPFAEALNNKAIGEMTPADIALFQSCIVLLSRSELAALKSYSRFTHYHANSTSGELPTPTCLVWTNDESRGINDLMLRILT
ncbi:hypothetical protein [Parasitella parasitica]|uniref:Uncharacterized protein n=1 Tax=Parasitella parasitica TaxID=35722 RepID=A0A0B7N6N7_9FUNG|nr:hypothetical protein [Parasitella parasitica]